MRPEGSARAQHGILALIDTGRSLHGYLKMPISSKVMDGPLQFFDTIERTCWAILYVKMSKIEGDVFFAIQILDFLSETSGPAFRDA